MPIFGSMYSCKAAMLSAPGPFGSSHELTSEEVGGGNAAFQCIFTHPVHRKRKGSKLSVQKIDKRNM
jgi:hypothetical protein